MLVIISCAKTMSFAEKSLRVRETEPMFLKEANHIAMEMSQYSVQRLSEVLKVNIDIATEVYRYFNEFCDENRQKISAIFAYTGIVFKHICPNEMTDDELSYAQKMLRITSFCYGLLRPFDLIKQYRMEGDIKLDSKNGKTMFKYWQEYLTDLFIDDVKKNGGVLCYLASEEMKKLFDWKKVERSVRVVYPEFKIMKNGKLSNVVVYAKMCRGEMSRYIIKNRIEKVEDLQNFCWEGFAFQPELSDEKKMMFVCG